jgi:hypothetical protein
MNFIRSKPEAIVMEITPALAKEMLETSTGNRTMRGHYIDMLASAMKRGEWKVTSQGIGFDSNGNLKDAHHRLNACVMSGVSFNSVVVFGMPVDAYEVTDIGMIRTYADRLELNKPTAEVLRLGCSYALGTNKPSIDQMRPIIDAGFGSVVASLIEYCGAKRKYYSSAPMKLAACITIMNGCDADFVLKQYKALSNLDFDSLTQSAKALIRQVEAGKANANDTRETLARGFRIFDKDREGVTRIQVSEADIDSSVGLVCSVLRNSVNS